MRPNFSNMASNCFANPMPIMSLASKRPIVTWWGFQSTNRKFMIREKLSCWLLLIHKSKVIMTIGVTSSWGWTYKSTQCNHRWKFLFQQCPLRWENKFWIQFQCQPPHPNIFTCVQGKKTPLAMSKTKSFKNSCWTSSSFL